MALWSRENVASGPLVRRAGLIHITGIAIARSAKMKTWTKPKAVETRIGMEINCYACATVKK